MTRSSKPYNWQRTEAKVEVRRPEVDEIAETLCDGGSVLVLGGRGMGKSVFLDQLQREIEQEEGIAGVVISAPPPRLNVEACLARLAKSLGVEADPTLDASDLVNAWFSGPNGKEHLILLFDEFDKYTDSGAARPLNPPGRAFFNELEQVRRGRPDLGILTAGSVGVFAFRDALGSSFLSRAEHRVLLPFDRAAVVELTAPFAERGRPLSEEVVDALLLASGGLPALVVYGLEELWKSPEPPVERDVTVAYARFQERHSGYIDDVYRAFVDPRLSQAPRRVLELFRQSDGSVPRDTLTEACAQADNPLDLKLNDVLMVLCAAGLLRLEGSFSAGNPVRGRAIPSILDLPTDTPPASDFQDRLYRDLGLLLDKLHRASADFYRQGAKAGEKRLVPESVFAAHLALGFEFLGWRAEREAQSAAGRTDIQLRYNGGTKVAVIEVKIWGRPGARDAQRQVESYWTAGVEACAVVQISDAASDEWMENYRGNLEGTVEPLPNEGSAWTCLAARRPEKVDVLHFLLGLPRR